MTFGDLGIILSTTNDDNLDILPRDSYISRNDFTNTWHSLILQPASAINH